MRPIGDSAVSLNLPVKVYYPKARVDLYKMLLHFRSLLQNTVENRWNKMRASFEQKPSTTDTVLRVIVLVTVVKLVDLFVHEIFK